jgi:magnesium transporter
MMTRNDAAMMADALLDFVNRDDLPSVRAALASLHPAEVANAIANLEPAVMHRVLALLPPDLAARTFGYLDLAMQADLLRLMPRAEVATLVSALPHDERVDLYKRLSPAEQTALLPGLAQAEREDIRRLAAYGEGTVGAAMTSDYVTLLPEQTIAQAIARLRQEAPDRETIYESYVLDANRRLIGVVSLRDLLLAGDDARVESVVRREVISVRADAPREDAARAIADYDLLAVPVINDDGLLVGIVTVDDAFDIAEAEDMLRLSGFGGTAALGGPDIDIRRSPFREMFGKRVFWLSVLTVFGIFTSYFVAAQEAILSEAIILAAFIAPIIDMGGNTGSQSATLVIRAMALGQVQLNWRDFGFLMKRDLPVAAALGLSIAALEAVMAYFTKSPGWDVIAVVGLSMLAVTLAGSIFGLILPFAARWLKTDPATLSAPMITSVMDLVGVFIYFGLAYAFLADRLTAA